MDLDSIIINLRLVLILIVGRASQFLSICARFKSRYPGMLRVRSGYDFSEYFNLDYHFTRFPPFPEPKTFLEAVFGEIPKLKPIEKTFFENSDGYYNFYVQNYRNILFLPDWFSKWIQVTFEIFDTTILDLAREVVFIMFFYYYVILSLRVLSYFFPTINPYTRPLVYIIFFTDWFEGFIFNLGFRSVTFLGLPLVPMFFSGLVGRIGDSLNHLVFTMPFLPSEGHPGRLQIDGELKDVIIFRYLPSLWAQYPIPDTLREFWYDKRPDIIQYMERNYGYLEIDFLPNKILKTLYHYQYNHNLVIDNYDKIHNFFDSMIFKSLFLLFG